MNKVSKQKYPPYKSGYLDVPDGHKIYHEIFGNPKGVPVLYLHGGPGIGFTDKDKRFFNPKKYKVVLFDQRGSGRSMPFASIKNNTTQKLVEDMNKLLDFLKLKKVILFGGSWGSTLALIYAIQNPDRVLGMIIRGIFLANQNDLNHYVGGGVEKHFPEAWERFVSLVPEESRQDLTRYYFEQMISADDKKADKHAFEWSYYESAISKMKISDKKILFSLKDGSYKALAVLEAHYILNNCFIPEDYILNNAYKLSHIPTVIVHGRYDFVCQPKNAYDLHKRIAGSKLHIVVAGHGSSEREIEKKLVEEIENFHV